MPEPDGVAATAAVTAGSAPTRVLILTTYDTDAEIERAVEAGAVGYLLKHTTREQLSDAIRAAARGALMAHHERRMAVVLRGAPDG